MKKLLLITTIAVTLAGISAFGQGTFVFSTAAGFVWDNFSGPSGVKSNDMKVAFLWANSASAITPLVDTQMGMGHVPTNYAPAALNATTAWAAILGDSSYHIATNTGNAIIIGTTTVTG